MFVFKGKLMSGKNLTFKLIMDGESKGLVNAAKQSQEVTQKLFDSIKKEADQVRGSTNEAAKGIDDVGKEAVSASKDIQKFDAELAQTNTELGKTDAVAAEATKGIQGLKTGYNALTGAMAALGIGVTVSELAQQADAYKNLTARIQIAIGEHGNIEKAMDDVIAVSLRTNANLEATGDLYARLTKIGTEMKWPQEQALELTEAINKAVAVGGGSAAANEAALTQLNQALGSGVLRGDEFNSIMEQSPRLSQAMADGLGVTTGELRKMAGEGQLTADVVTKAILSQADTITKEFEKFPLTIGNSIENLKTSWMVYLGELDKTHGISERAANAIKYLAENLESIGSMLGLAARAFIAYKALNIANTFLDKAAGVRAASVAITQETTAVVANTQAQLANAAATRGAAVAKTQLATNSAAATTASAATTSSIGTLIGRLGALGVAVTAVGVLIPTVFEPMGTWIGESVAKLQGYGEAFEKLASQQALEAARAKVAAEIKAEQAAIAEKARDKTYQLTEESKKLAVEFDELVKKGEPTKEALEKISNAMKFDSTKGINDAVTALILLKDQGKITADDLQEQLAKALDGKNLLAFETNAKAAFQGTSQEASKSAAITEAVMKAALGRTGLDAEQLKGRFSEAFQSASNDVQTIINNLEAYKAQGVDTGLALSTNLNKAIDTAQTRAEIDYAKSSLIKFGEQGLITGEQVALGLTKIEQKAAQLPAALNPVEAAFGAMGVKTKDQLDEAAAVAKANFDVVKKSGQATALGIQQAYTNMLNKAIDTGDQAQIALAKAQAASLGLEVQLDATGKATVTKLGEMQQAAVQTQRVIQQASKTVESGSSNNQDETDPMDALRKKMSERVAKSNAAAQARRGGSSPNISTPSIAVPDAAVPEAPLIASSFDTKALESEGTVKTVSVDFNISGEKYSVPTTQSGADSLEELAARLEQISRGQ